MADSTVTSSHQFCGASAGLRAIADKHFKDDCFERRKLLEVSEYFNQLWMLHYQLKRIEERLECIRGIAAPEPVLIKQLAMYLDNIAPTVRGDEAANAVRKASGMLHIWSDVHINLDALMHASDELRFLADVPAGSA